MSCVVEIMSIVYNTINQIYANIQSVRNMMHESKFAIHFSSCASHHVGTCLQSFQIALALNNVRIAVHWTWHRPLFTRRHIHSFTLLFQMYDIWMIIKWHTSTRQTIRSNVFASIFPLSHRIFQ